MLKLLINGVLEEGAHVLDVVDPATGEIFAQAPRASKEQLDKAVAAAKAAFPVWSSLPHSERAKRMLALADALELRADEFAELLTREQGKPLAQSRGEVGGSIAAFRYFATQSLHSHKLVDDDETLVVELRAPLGVVAAITPWNFPLVLLAIKVATALTTGNTVVAKPAPTTPLTTALLGEVACTILPPGVLNIVVDANDLGSALASHTDVAKVSFTGSTATGRKVMASGADTLKRLTLELGGNDVAIVLDDVDVDDVAPKIFAAATLNAGQVCMAAKRIYAPRAIYRKLCEALAKLARDAVVGNGLEPETSIGPIQNRVQYEKLLDLIEDAGRSGTIMAGGQRLNRKGFFIAPTVVADLVDTDRLVTEEQFGPVIPVLAYDTIDEVITRANVSEFGLGGTVWGKDIDRAIAVASQIETGTVWVNKHLDLRFDVPFGGIKQSGLGREQGEDGLREFTQARIINVQK